MDLLERLAQECDVGRDLLRGEGARCVGRRGGLWAFAAAETATAATARGMIDRTANMVAPGE